MDKKDIVSMNLGELKEEIKALGESAFRAGQIYAWLHKSAVTDFYEMTNISKQLREKLANNFDIYGCTIEKKLVSVYDNTVKYLFRLHDGEFIESVVMKYKYGYTICVSSQVGCKMGCKFCASTKAGFVRNLYPSEILGQIYAAQRDLNIRISHVVLMGVGEPMDNFDNVMRFLELVSDENGVNIGMRNISLSTCGVVDGIYKLLEKKLQLTLSISLHAPNDEIRSRTMPVNSKWNIDTLLKACRKYAAETSRRISFEYAMISGVNDSDECAGELAQRLKGMLCHVNLIPVNEVEGTGCKKSSPERLKRFISILEAKGITATVRRTLGSDINASCGQLRIKHKDGGSTQK
ncbi:MAG: 23S rRNA (adenine(2503)-C(2))-methyltransferase RlmN [Clostridia bacterium]|nr:23S rRNA (adenine(2503)-C(2))-methyltransferase RlmN [Clostridia bacterium]